MSAVASKAPAKAKGGVFGGLTSILAEGFDPILSKDDRMERVNVDDILVLPQVREEFEDEDNLLSELGESLQGRQLQNIVVRPNPEPGKPYILVIGERRLRSAQASGQGELWALIATMSDDEAEEAQFAENVQRKNLTLLEEAKRIQRDVEQLGSTDAVLAKHKKSHAWLSKRLSLVDLPDQARRLMKENISADVEVIQNVKVIEQRDAGKAKALVDELKAGRGKVNARALAQSVKAQVKPKQAKAGGAVATSKDRSHEEPGAATVFAPAKNKGARPSHEAPLVRAYEAIFEAQKAPQSVLDAFDDGEREAAESYLATFYEAGKQAVDPARIVIEGFRNGGFASDGLGAFALVAYLHGADRKAKFSLLNILGAVKP